MQRFLHFLRINFRPIGRVGLFLGVVFIILSLFPNVQHFKYAYKKGTPWKGETLYAPFDFGIKKTESQLQAERDSLMKIFKSYFVYDKHIVDLKVIIVQHHLSRDSLLQKLIIDKIRSIYDKGIINPNIHHFPKGETIIKLVRENISKDVWLKDLYTPNTAYEEFMDKVHNLDNNQIADVDKLLSFGKIFEANIVFNKGLTERHKRGLIEGVIENRGVIQVDERIVSKGEIVDDKTYQILESLRYEYSKRIGITKRKNHIVLGQFILIFFCILILYLFLSNYRKSVMQNIKQVLLILIFLTGFVTITILVLRYPDISVYVIPYALVAIVIRTFIDSRTALFTYVVTILLSSYLIGYEFLFIQIVTGIISVLSLSRLQQRSQLFFAAFFVFITYSILYFAFEVTQENGLKNMDYKPFMWFVINGVLLSIAYFLLYVIEKVFGFLSDITLIELSNTNNKILRKLTQVAPGTFQHSMQVANLSEEAVYAIGKGNPLLIRTGALYHDIGKMKNPAFFIENQHINFNPHKNLTYKQSAAIIIEHVTEGVKIAKRNNLPEQIIDFIKTHHGCSRTEFFYRSHKKSFPDKKIDESKFTYPGPDPLTLEQAVMMMADICEAASRSLKEKTEKSIQHLIISLIDSYIENGRFNNAPITFQNIATIKKVFIDKLLNIYHARIEYPKEEKLSQV